MKKFLKKFGKYFVVLNKKEEQDLHQFVLLVDGNSILPNNFSLIVKGVKDKFRNANFIILAFQDRKEFLQDNFADVKIVTPDTKIRVKRYQLALQLRRLLRQKNFDFVVLSSLDISTILVSLFFSKCPVLLHNRWFEWYQIRLRTIGDILRGVKSIDKNRKPYFRSRNGKSIKAIIRSLGRIFVILTDMARVNTRRSILIEDNGYTEIGHISAVVERAEKIFVNPDITILTFQERKHYFMKAFAQTKVEAVEQNKIYNFAKQMYRMRKIRFDCIILTALDILPVTVALGCTCAKVLLYNQWHQWWSLELRNVKGYLKGILKAILNIPTAIYLLIVSGFILLRTFVRAQFMNLRMAHPKE